MARTDTLNAANVANEVTVFAGANGGRRPKVLAVKDSTVAAAAQAVSDGGTLGHFDILIDGTLAASGWEGRARVLPRGPEAMLADARSVERRRRPFAAAGAGAAHPYGGGSDNY
jgi:hypothetical protein